MMYALYKKRRKFCKSMRGVLNKMGTEGLQVQRSRIAVNPWVVAITVTIATFMELLDTSIANVALPHIAGGLGRSFDEATWVLTTYLVANAVVLPMSAWLSRVFGRKNYYMACVVLFTISSLLCGIAPSLPFMLMARILQGVGGGGLAPVEQAILVDTFPPSTPSQLSRHLPLAQWWAAGSRITSTGAGASSSTFRSGCFHCS